MGQLAQRKLAVLARPQVLRAQDVGGGQHVEVAAPYTVQHAGVVGIEEDDCAVVKARRALPQPRDVRGASSRKLPVQLNRPAPEAQEAVERSAVSGPWNRRCRSRIGDSAAHDDIGSRAVQA